MMKIRSFFTGILLLVIVFIMVVVTALIYRANERANIRTYMFQMNNNAYERIGEMQNINNISQNDFRNKLISKYISEYFKVIPGDKNVTKRPVLKEMSKSNVFEQWKNDEAKAISEMSSKKMFRMARAIGIDTLHNTDNNSDTSHITKPVYYVVRYETLTWPQSNIMGIEPEYNQGVIYMELLFEPGLKEHIDNKKINIKKYLESGGNPVELFRFQVTYIGSKGVK